VTDCEHVIGLKLLQSFLGTRARNELPTSEEASAWAAFYDAHARMIPNVMRRCGTRESNIHDLTQHVWLILLNRLVKFNFDPDLGTVEGYIDTITSHEAGRHRRRASKSRDVTLTTELVAELLDPQVGPVNQFEGKESHEQMRTILADARVGLSELSGRIVEMRLIEGKTIPEIAEALAVSEGAVKMRLFRALSELRASLRGKGLGPQQENFQ
jgi:RNA polymerase sigma factor (sigma-70 family)